jgi:transcriptional regulator with XRE-family HTH domain
MRKSMTLDTASLEGREWVSRYVSIVAENIKSRRGSMTQEDLAKKAGVSRTVVQRAESGLSIQFDNLLKIARALSVEPADLYITEDDQRAFNAKTKKLVDALYDVLMKKEGK